MKDKVAINIKDCLSGKLTFGAILSTGRVKTTARWIRDFVREHADYKHDSVITEQINYDLIKLCADISEGKVISHHLNV